MAKTRAQSNRALRQEALREQLAAKGLIQKVLDNIQKMDELDEASETFSNALNKLKTSNEQRLKLVNKYLPDLKSEELTGEGGEELKVTIIERQIVRAKHTNS